MVFVLYFAQFALPLTNVESTSVRKSPKFFWLFAHLFVPLTTSKVGCISEIKTKKMVFCFVFRSICTTFAADLAKCLSRGAHGCGLR